MLTGLLGRSGSSKHRSAFLWMLSINTLEDFAVKSERERNKAPARGHCGVSGQLA